MADTECWAAIRQRDENINTLFSRLNKETRFYGLMSDEPVYSGKNIANILETIRHCLYQVTPPRPDLPKEGIKLTGRERAELRYLERQPFPIWGGHLTRRQPLSDPQMKRWLELGLIEQVKNKGYRISEFGSSLLANGD